MTRDAAPTRPLTALDPGARTIDRIVVPRASWAGYEPALATATDLAVRRDLAIHVVNIVTGDSVDLVDPGASMRAAHPELTITAETVHAEAGEDAVSALTRLLHASDLVVMASGAGVDSATSFAQSLAHAWGGPVMMLGPACPKQPLGAGMVAVALDGSALAERVLSLAHDFSMAFDVPLDLVQIVPEATSRHVAALAARGEQVSESAYIGDLAALLNDAGIRSSWSIVHDDDPVRGLTTFLHNHDVALLVMATHGQSGVLQPAFGSTCLHMVRQAAIPVVVVRPTSAAVPMLDVTG